VRHAIEAARLTSADTDRQEELVQHVLRRVAAVTPPHTVEIAFDRLFIEEIRTASAANIAFVVRGSPILNDVTAVDAEVVGLTDWVRMVASGEGAPGCELDRSPPEVCALFDSADLIISKGQGNYEALSDEPYPIYFFLKVKCPVIERDIGARKGDSVLKRSDRKGR
jgi:uncharacterized protein with ATP-grasp and redox domains